jgi:pimeloyl-ACP methyl ester carboxylesterase
LQAPDLLYGVMPIVPPEREHAVELTDGRRLGVAEFGDATGRPVFWFHGTPGARRQVPPAARRLARSENLRVVGVERSVGCSPS